MSRSARGGRRLPLAAVALLALAAVGPACAVDPVTGSPGVVLISRGTEYELGRQVRAEVERKIGFSDDRATVDYVRAVGARVASRSPRKDVDHVFHVIEMEEPNAFAGPDGLVYVSRGLLALLDSEDELAGVLGHEIAHIAARHTADRTTVAAPFVVVAGMAGFAAGLIAKPLGSAVAGSISLLSSFVVAPHSRAQEHEADEIGVSLAARAGYDPDALGRALRKLQRAAGAPEKAGFFATHPTTPSRLAELDAVAKQAARGQAAPVAEDRAAFLARLDGLVVGPNPAAGVVVGDRFVHPELGFSIAFPASFTVVNRPQAVGAEGPRASVAMMLAVAGGGSDPAATAREFRRRAGLDLGSRLEPAAAGDGAGPAVRAVVFGETEHGEVALDLFWIAHGDRIYLLTGLCPRGLHDVWAKAFADAVASFHSLRPEERAAVRVNRLRVVAARGGETVAALAARTGTVWSPAVVATANGIDEGAALEEGQPVKVALREAYEGRAR